MQGSYSQDHVPDVQVVGGKIVQAPGAPPIAKIWLPRDGQVIATIPAMKGNRRWLHTTVRIRSPRLADDRWLLPRNCLTNLITAAVDRFGYVAVVRDMSKLSKCTRACLEAIGANCDCSCLGAQHGTASEGWFESFGDVMVAEHGKFTRSVVVYQARGGDSDAGIYAGELSGHRYRADRKSRTGWPKAAQFMCAGCMTARARVWDHCHAHGYVRAPLCNTCNTRYWSGWNPEHGRATTSSNLDTSYYEWCRNYGLTWAGPCSA